MAELPATFKDVTDFRFKCASKIRVFDEPFSSFAAPLSLLATANKYGVVFVGTPTGLKVFASSSLFDHGNETDCSLFTIPIRGISHVAVNCDDSLLLIVFKQGPQTMAYFLDVQQTIAGQLSLLPAVVLAGQPHLNLCELAWSPTMPNIVCFCWSDGALTMYNVAVNSANPVASIQSANATCVSWSPKGKQLVAGSRDGLLTQYHPDLRVAKTLAKPASLGQHTTILAVSWLSSFQFAVVYKLGEADENRLTLCVVDAPKQGPISCVDYDDICFSSGELRPHQFYLLIQSAWNIVLCASANGMEVGVLGQCQGNYQPPRWQQWATEDSARAELPMEGSSDTFPLGMILNTSTTQSLTLGEETLSPMPMLVLLSHKGMLCSFHVLNLQPNIVSTCSPPTILYQQPIRQQAAPVSNDSVVPQQQASPFTKPVSEPAHFQQPSQQAMPPPPQQFIPQAQQQPTMSPFSTQVQQSVPQFQQSVPQFQQSPIAQQSPMAQQQALMAQPKQSVPQFQQTMPQLQQTLPQTLALIQQNEPKQVAPQVRHVQEQTVPKVVEQPEPPKVEVVPKPELSNEVYLSTASRIVNMFVEELSSFISKNKEFLQKNGSGDGRMKVQEKVAQVELDLQALSLKSAELRDQCKNIQTLSIDNLHVQIEIKALINQRRNPGYTHLSRTRPLNYLSKCQLDSIQQNLMYIESQLEQVANQIASLEHQDESKKLYGLSSAMALHRTINYNQGIIRYFHAKISKIQHQASQRLSITFDDNRSSGIDLHSLSRALSNIGDQPLAKQLIKKKTLNIKNENLMFQFLQDKPVAVTRARQEPPILDTQSPVFKTPTAQIPAVTRPITNQFGLGGTGLLPTPQQFGTKSQFSEPKASTPFGQTEPKPFALSSDPKVSTFDPKLVPVASPGSFLGTSNKPSTFLGGAQLPKTSGFLPLTSKVETSTTIKTAPQEIKKPIPSFQVPITKTSEPDQIFKVPNPTMFVSSSNEGFFALKKDEEQIRNIFEDSSKLTSVFGTKPEKPVEIPKEVPKVVPKSVAATPSPVFGGSAILASKLSADTTKTPAVSKPFVTSTPTFGTSFGTPSIFATSQSPPSFGSLVVTPVTTSVITTTSSTPIFGGTPSTSLFGTVETAKVTTPSFGTSTTDSLNKPIFSGTVTTSETVVTPTSTDTLSKPLFVTPSTPSSTTTTSSSIFGQSVPTTSTPSLFGQTSTTTPSIFGQTVTTKPTVTTPLFSQTSAAQTTPSIFGQTTQASSIFGQTTTTASTTSTPVTTQTTSVFGETSTVFGQTPKTTPSTTPGVVSSSKETPSLFGQQTTPSVFGGASTSVFGQAPSGTPSANIFGQVAVTTTTASTPSSSNVFGQTTTPASSIFGQPVAVTTSTSTPASTNVFGQSASVFGKTDTPTVFGQTTPAGSSVFGQTAPVASIFGQASTPSSANVFGQAEKDATSQVTNLFGGMSATSSSGMFGQSSFDKPAASIFGGGAPSSDNLFGNTAACSPFGVKSDVSKNLFGGESPANPFSKTTSFGQTASPNLEAKSIFGQTVTPAFGSPATLSANQPSTDSVFGTSPNKFGGGAAFGAPPTFGGGATFGGSPAFGAGASPGTSIFGGSSFGQHSPSTFQQNNAFSAIAAQNTVTFGNLAQQSPPAAVPQPQFGNQQNTPVTKPSFSSWR